MVSVEDLDSLKKYLSRLSLSDSSYTFPSVLIVSQQAKNTAVNFILASVATALRSQFNLLCREKTLVTLSHVSFLGTFPFIGVNFIIDH